MTDKTKYSTPPTPLPHELLANPDAFFAGDLLSGGQLLPLKKFRIEVRSQPFLSVTRRSARSTDRITLNLQP